MAVILSEYLEKLGWSVDKNSLNEAINSMKKFSGAASALQKITSSSLFIAGKAVAGTIYTLLESTASYVDSVAQADLATEKFARKMWTTEEAARAFNTALSALGYKNYTDIFYMTEEEYNRFVTLRDSLASLEPPKETQETLKTIRDISTEFKNIFGYLDYLGQWVVYWIGRKSGKELDSLRDSTKKFSDFIKENISNIAEKIATLINFVYSLGKAGAYLLARIKELYEFLEEKLPDGTLKAGAGLAALFAIMKSGPIGWMIAGLTTLLLLLDDFVGWQEGKEAAFPTLWAKLEDFMNSDKIDTIVAGFNTFSDAVNSLVDLFKGTGLGTVETVEGVKKSFFKDPETGETGLEAGSKAYAALEANKVGSRSWWTDIKGAWNYFQDWLFKPGEYIDRKVSEGEQYRGMFNLNATINVDGSKNPEETANIIKYKLGDLTTSYINAYGIPRWNE